MPEKFASVPSPEPTYSTRQLAKATAEQNAIELRKVVALETIAAEFQRFNDRKATRDLQSIFNLIDARERTRAGVPTYGPTEHPDVGQRDANGHEYFPATDDGRQTLQQLLRRALDPSPAITRWRVTGNPLP